MPTDFIRSLLAAYEVKMDASVFNVGALEEASDMKDGREPSSRLFRAHDSSRLLEIAISSIQPRFLPAWPHPTAAAILDRLGLTSLKITGISSDAKILRQHSARRHAGVQRQGAAGDGNTNPLTNACRD